MEPATALTVGLTCEAWAGRGGEESEGEDRCKYGQGLEAGIRESSMFLLSGLQDARGMGACQARLETRACCRAAGPGRLTVTILTFWSPFWEFFTLAMAAAAAGLLAALAGGSATDCGDGGGAGCEVRQF